MPNYEYECPKCNTKRVVQKPISLYDEKEQCTCGTTMNKIFSCQFNSFRGKPVTDEGDYMTGKTIDIEV